MGHASRLTVLGSWMLAAGCAVAPTRIQTSWTDPTYDGGPFGRVAVVALFDTEAESRRFEQLAAEHLQERGVEAVEAQRFLEPDREYTYEEMEAELADTEVAGILIFRLIAVDERRGYHPPTPYLHSVPPAIIVGDPYFWYYYPHWNYYWHWRATRDVVRSPGYWTETSYLVVETSLYDNASDQLVWTAKSETMDDTQFERLADSIVNAVSRQLFAADLLGSAEPARGAAAPRAGVPAAS
ncbi:MAG TPA: hypothetical protein VF322_08585 [Gammaproteobacteria bacterium]